MAGLQASLLKACVGPHARTHTLPVRAERGSLFSSSHPLEIQFLIRAPALMNICSSGTPTARMSEFVFTLKFFLTPVSQGTRRRGGRLELKRPFTFSPERVGAVGAARDIRPPASPPLVSSIMCGSSLRRVSERLPISAPYAWEPPSLLPSSEMSSVVCRRRSPIQPDDNCRVDTSLDL